MAVSLICTCSPSLKIVQSPVNRAAERNFVAASLSPLSRSDANLLKTSLSVQPVQPLPLIRLSKVEVDDGSLLALGGGGGVGDGLDSTLGGGVRFFRLELVDGSVLAFGGVVGSVEVLGSTLGGGIGVKWEWEVVGEQESIE